MHVHSWHAGKQSAHIHSQAKTFTLFVKEHFIFSSHFCNSYSGAMLAEARQRMMEYLLRLRVTEVRAHAEILTSVCQAQPAFAGDYLARAPLVLEPELTARWFAATSILGQIISAAALDRSE